MPRYYCDYCDAYLTHDSPVVRKQHNTGYKHKANVKSYYTQFMEAQMAQQPGAFPGMPPMGFPGGPPGMAPPFWRPGAALGAGWREGGSGGRG